MKIELRLVSWASVDSYRKIGQVSGKTVVTYFEKEIYDKNFEYKFDNTEDWTLFSSAGGEGGLKIDQECRLRVKIGMQAKESFMTFIFCFCLFCRVMFWKLTKWLKPNENLPEECRHFPCKQKKNTIFICRLMFKVPYMVKLTIKCRLRWVLSQLLITPSLRPCF